MPVGYNVENDVVGGGLGAGGLGGGLGFLPWLLLFANRDGGIFGGNGNEGAGVLAGQTQAKLDCLTKGQSSIETRQAESEVSNRFFALSNQLTGAERQMSANAAANTSEHAGILARINECCCENLVGQQKIETAIAMQTNTLLINEDKNTQRILDNLAATTLQNCQQDAANLRSQLTEQTVLNAIKEDCGSRRSSGMDIDINVLARALQGQGKS